MSKALLVSVDVLSIFQQRTIIHTLQHHCWEKSSETTVTVEKVFQGHCCCAAHGSTNHLAEGLLWHVLDGLPQLTQGMDGGAVAAGQVVSGHRDEVVLAALQVEYQDVFNLFLARIKLRRR